MTGAGSSVVTVGDAIIDVIELEDGTLHRVPGGASLNVAVGLARLGVRSELLTSVGLDAAGGFAVDFARRHGVRVRRLPHAGYTGVATSRRRRPSADAEYEFSRAVYRRHYFFDDGARQCLRRAGAVTASSYPIGDLEQAARLAEVMRMSPGIGVIDPNPRATIDSGPRFLEGFGLVADAADVLKFSDEDLELMYGRDAERELGDYLARGKTIVLTHGAEGASVRLPAGRSARLPVVDLPEPVVDTLGAGDAVLASVVARVVEHGLTDDIDVWYRTLEIALENAARTCRHVGGLLRLVDGG